MHQPDNLTLVHLRRIDQRSDQLIQDMVEANERLGFLERRYSAIPRRLDRLGRDVEVIKRRLDLVDTAD